MTVPSIEHGAPLVAQDQFSGANMGSVDDPYGATTEVDLSAPTYTPTETTDAALGLGGTGSPPPTTGNAPSGGSVGDIARSYLGVPYVWAGNGRNGIDCSGLTRAVYKAAFGINLPRISYQQANGGTRTPWAKMKAGDLVAWDNSSRNPGADHIAIYMGNGWIIEAPHPGAKVRLRRLDFNGYDRQAWGVSYAH